MLYSQKETAACFAGHRSVSRSLELENTLYDTCASLVRRGVTTFLSGGTAGFDSLAALSVLRLRKTSPGVRLVMALPFQGQELLWSEADKHAYNQILLQADKVVCVSDHYYNGCMQRRNRYLVDNSAYCVCYLLKSSGATAYTASYAKQRGLEIINLASNIISLPGLTD